MLSLGRDLEKILSEFRESTQLTPDWKLGAVSKKKWHFNQFLKIELDDKNEKKFFYQRNNLPQEHMNLERKKYEMA